MRIKSILALILFILLNSGCKIYNEINNPEKQFVFINEKVYLSACHKNNKSLCIGEKKGTTSASGFLVKTNEKNSFYLTAGHACEKDFQINKELQDEFEVIQRRDIFLYNYTGEALTAEIVDVDKKNDLCLLKSSISKERPVSISRKMSKRHSKVYNIAAPSAMWKKDMMIKFDGEYQGLLDEMDLYTLVAHPGSSGSPIFDYRTKKVIGMVISVLQPSYSLVRSPTLQSINNFLEKNNL